MIEAADVGVRARPRRQWSPGVTWALDFVLAALLALLVVSGSVGEAKAPNYGGPLQPYPPNWAFALVAVAALVLIGRRRWPQGTFAVSLVAVLVYTGLGYVDGAALVAPMVGLYNVATRVSRRRALTVGLLTLVTLLSVDSAFEPFGLTGGTVLVVPFEVAATLFLGLAVANHRAYLAEVEDRAAGADRAREEEARRRVDAERLRIARELHDVVAHSIAMINVQAGVAAHVISEQPDEAARALVAIKGASKEALRELRTILDVLRQADEGDSMAPAPGLSQLDALVSTTTQAGLPTMLTVSGAARRLAPIVDLAAYRIVQESLTNVLRHAGPASASVSVTYRADDVVIAVEDDGRGVPREGGLALLLDSAPDIEVVGEAGDGQVAVALARQTRADLVLMDIRMPGVDGLEATRRIEADEDLAGVKVLILTTFEADDYVFEALRAGASGFMVKDTEPADLLQAVRVVARGDSLLSPGVTRRLIAEVVSRSERIQGSPAALAVLTDREREVMALVAGGLSNEEIAAELYLSPLTAKTHVSRAMSKLGARDRAQLVVLAYQSGLVSTGRS